MNFARNIILCNDQDTEYLCPTSTSIIKILLMKQACLTMPTTILMAVSENQHENNMYGQQQHISITIDTKSIYNACMAQFYFLNDTYCLPCSSIPF